MYQNLDVFRTAHAMARHAGTRQAVIARNIANADTPGYQAKDIAPFQQVFSGRDSAAAMRSSRSGHVGGASMQARIHEARSETVSGNPNENTVSLELEMLKAVEVKRQHDRALAIYKSSMTILRAAIGRR